MKYTFVTCSSGPELGRNLRSCFNIAVGLLEASLMSFLLVFSPVSERCRALLNGSGVTHLMMTVLTGFHGTSEALDTIWYSSQDLYPPALRWMLWKLWTIWSRSASVVGCKIWPPPSCTLKTDVTSLLSHLILINLAVRALDKPTHDSTKTQRSRPTTLHRRHVRCYQEHNALSLLLWERGYPGSHQSFRCKGNRLDDKWGSRSKGWMEIHVVVLVWTYTAKFMHSESVIALRTRDRLR